MIMTSIPAAAVSCVTALLLLAGCVTTGETSEDRPPAPGPATGADEFTVVSVISGDLVKLDSGEEVRYAGIRAPAENEELFAEARNANERLVSGKDIRVKVVFVDDRRDEGGRRFAHVYTPGAALKLMTWVNAELLEGGFGRLDYTALSDKFEQRFEEREAAARAEKRGIWKYRG